MRSQLGELQCDLVRLNQLLEVSERQEGLMLRLPEGNLRRLLLEQRWVQNQQQLLLLLQRPAIWAATSQEEEGQNFRESLLQQQPNWATALNRLQSLPQMMSYRQDLQQHTLELGQRVKFYKLLCSMANPQSTELLSLQGARMERLRLRHMELSALLELYMFEPQPRALSVERLRSVLGRVDLELDKMLPHWRALHRSHLQMVNREELLKTLQHYQIGDPPLLNALQRWAALSRLEMLESQESYLQDSGRDRFDRKLYLSQLQRDQEGLRHWMGELRKQCRELLPVELDRREQAIQLLELDLELEQWLQQSKLGVVRAKMTDSAPLQERLRGLRDRSNLLEKLLGLDAEAQGIQPDLQRLQQQREELGRLAQQLESLQPQIPLEEPSRPSPTSRPISGYHNWRWSCFYQHPREEELPDRQLSPWGGTLSGVRFLVDRPLPRAMAQAGWPLPGWVDKPQPQDRPRLPDYVQTRFRLTTEGGCLASWYGWVPAFLLLSPLF
jgi:hypothetical protein